MSRFHRLIGFAVLLLSSIAPAVSATTTVYTDRATFLAQLQASHTEDFESDIPGNYPTPYTSAEGTVFSTISGGGGTIQILRPGLVNGTTGPHFREFGPGMRFTLSAATRAVGFSYDTAIESWTVEFRGTTQLLPPFEKGFVGFIDDSASSNTLNFTASAGAQGGLSTDDLTTGTACIAPSISSQPTSQTVCEGSSVTFSVGAGGTGPLSFQWRRNGGVIGGATGPSYTINPVVSGIAGSFTVVVTNACGSVTSNAATLTVSLRPTISTHPTSRAACAGSSTTFSVVASGTPPFSYEWRKNGGVIGGATGSSFTINPVTSADAANYTVVVTNGCGSIQSNPATLVVPVAPTILNHPASVGVCPGDTAGFNVNANGTPPLSYQWRLNGNVIGGATGPIYVINPVSSAHAGTYTVVVTNACGSVTSAAATLTVLVPPTITSQPASQVLCPGDAATFSVGVAGSPTLVYSWARNGVSLTDGGAISGSSTSTLVIDPVAGADAGSYDVLVTNDCGQAMSLPAVLSVNAEAPLAPAAPGGPEYGYEGISVEFTVVTTDPQSDPIVYTFDWGDGTTSASAEVPSGIAVSLSHAYVDEGLYSITVVASDDCGNDSAASPVATVDIADIECRAGNVLFDQFAFSVDVLFANGSSGAGNPPRIVNLKKGLPLKVVLLSSNVGPFGAQAKYAIWLWNQRPTSTTDKALPMGLGKMCMNPLLANCGAACPIYAAKTIAGNCAAVLCSTPEATLAELPELIMEVPANTFVAGDILWIQGLLRDASDTSGSQISITNGIEVHVID